MKHITILAYGTRGDVQPYVALGVYLKQAGYAVRLAAPALFQPFVAEYDLDFAPLAGDPRILMGSVVARLVGRPDVLRSLPVVLKYTMPVALQVLADARQACQGHAIATRSRRRWAELALQWAPRFFGAALCGFAPTKDFPTSPFKTAPREWLTLYGRFLPVYWRRRVTDLDQTSQAHEYLPFRMALCRRIIPRAILAWFQPLCT